MKIIQRFFIIIGIILLSASYADAKELISYSHLTDGYWQIWVMNPDGTDQRQVTSSQIDKRAPVWLNEGRIAYRTGNSELFVVNMDGTGEQQYLKKFGIVANPDFDEVNNQVVFIRFDPVVSDVSDIWASDLDGFNSRILTKDNYPKFQPAVSKDGKHIAFVKGDEKKGRNFYLWMINRDGSDMKQLTTGVTFDTLPDFSPDDSKIIFTSNRLNRNFEIFEIDLKSLAIEQITNDPGLDTMPSYSVNGKSIIFVSSRDGNQQIWKMSADGTNPVRLTDGEESIEPAWGEIPGE